MVLTLARCVPYFPDNTQLANSLLLLLIAKPLTYVFFVLCFRYRVSTPMALSIWRLGVIVVGATLGGFALILADALVRTNFGNADGVATRGAADWLVLTGIRTSAWTFLGWLVAGLRGRRLAGWVVSAVGLDLAFDVAVSTAYDGAWIESCYVAMCLLLCLVPLYMIGRRPSLTGRYVRFLGARQCRQCGYDLRGNASGVCPECGTLRATY